MSGFGHRVESAGQNQSRAEAYLTWEFACQRLDGHMGRQILDRVGRSVAFLAPSGQAMTLWISMVIHAVGLGLIVERL